VATYFIGLIEENDWFNVVNEPFAETKQEENSWHVKGQLARWSEKKPALYLFYT
jgi:hypothetical protein